MRAVIRLPFIESWEPSGATRDQARACARKLTQQYKGESGILLSKGKTKDKYNRIISDVQMGDYTLSQLIVQAGLAWYGVGKPNPGNAASTLLY